MADKAKVLVLYYSMFGNVAEMARAVGEGVSSVDGAELVIKTVPELVPDEVIKNDARMIAVKKKYADVPIATSDDLVEADAIIVGTPTRFGNMCAQMRNFWDMTGGLWGKGSLIGKPGSVFVSTASLHGGQETTAVSVMFTLIHHGMIIVGVPYSVPELLTTKAGGTPYGASHTAGPTGEIPVDEAERRICFEQGKRVAELAVKLKG
jgi:NAD(P)H dehydrogenase (quinone)